MKYSSLLAIFLAFFLISPPATSTGNENEFRPDLFVYRWKEGPPKEVSRVFGRRIHKITLGLSDSQIRSLFVLTSGQVDLLGLYSLRRPPTQNFEELADYPGLLDRIVTGAPPPSMPQENFLDESGDPGITPDPELKGQWWIDRLKVTEAWKLASGRGITIADCDAGFYINDPDLRDSLVVDKRYSITNTADHLNVEAGRFVGHGTSVSAIMAGPLNNLGTNGIAYNAKVVPLQNYTYDPEIDKMDKEEATAQCVLRAIATEDVKIIVIENQTHGSSETFAGTREAVRLALKAGITIVSTAGNSNRRLEDEEKDDTGSIIVGAVYMSDDKAYFSNWGARVVISAFGERVRTLVGPGAYGDFGGTSAATPQVAATVAMMLEVNPKLTPSQIKTILHDTRITTPKNTTVGGRLDTLAAVQSAKTMMPDERGFTRANELRRRANRILNNR